MPETLRSRLKDIANRLLAPAGLQLSRSDRTFDMDGLLARAVRRGCKPRTIIDVGASDGIWSLRARRHFPRAQYVLFEPLAEHQDALDVLKKQKGFDIVAAAAGAQRGTVAFTVDPKLDGSAVAPNAGHATRTVPVETIDEVVTSRAHSGPYLLKLDTHGYEVPVLTGASSVLEQTDLIVIEAYNFALTPDCLRFHELCAWIEDRGFRCCDLADPMRRPTDGVFWQVDLAFARSDSPMFRSDAYG